MPTPWERRQAQQAGIPIGPQDPTAPYRGEKAALDNRAAAAGIQNDAERVRIAQEQLRLAQQNAEMEARLKQFEIANQERQASSADPFNQMALTSAANDAASKLSTINRIEQKYRNSSLPVVGFGAETLSGIGGTGAASVNAELGTLKSGGALTEVLKMTQATGKNPFTPMSNSDVELIAQNIGNLSQRSDPETFFANLDNYKKAYNRAYVGAVGARELGSEMDRLGLNTQQRARAKSLYESDPRVKYADQIPDNMRPKINEQVKLYASQPGVTPGQVRIFRDVLTKRIIERKGAPKNAPRTQPGVIDFNEWKGN